MHHGEMMAVAGGVPFRAAGHGPINGRAIISAGLKGECAEEGTAEQREGFSRHRNFFEDELGFHLLVLICYHGSWQHRKATCVVMVRAAMITFPFLQSTKFALSHVDGLGRNGSLGQRCAPWDLARLVMVPEKILGKIEAI